ncbi:MAG: protein kinase [Planctomycetes bacterium]|nr:protein kinase [Planctomycetota bacterium]
MGDENTGGSETSTRHDPLVGRRLASYEVMARVARGGMGVVYRARHVYIDKIVALKVLDPALSQREDLIERFRTEAQSLARVEHDNVVKVIDILEDKGVHFIVMDFAEGVNLRNLVKDKGPMTGDQLLSVARQTAEALYAAHREGILHRDIKPENLIMNSRGRCKLADFGLAGDLRLISEGHEGPLNFGTPAYSAPEVLRRMVPDKRSDVFSFGATLYFLATGEPPFGQTGAQAIMLRQQQGAELLESRRPDLPPKFSQLVMDCLQYHPKHRPSNFVELMERLPRRMVTRAIPGTPTSPTEPTDAGQLDSGTHESPEPIGSKALWIGLMVFAAMALAVVLVLWVGPLVMDSSPPVNQDARQPAANVPVNRPPGNTGASFANSEPEHPLPAFRPEDESFSDAELNSRSALMNTDYKGAWDAWGTFIRRYPDSEYVSQARQRQGEVLTRVVELRGQEYDKAKQASDEALREKRTGEAIAALDRFPAGLLVAIGDKDDVDVQRKLDTQRQIVIAVEASDLARLLESAEALRADWQQDRDNAAALTEIRRLRSAGNLLKERDLLETFLPGRTTDTQEKVEKRLTALRKIIEGMHQSAQDIADAWRRFHDETLGVWADRVLEVIEGQTAALERRDLTGPLREIEDLEQELKGLQALVRGSAAHPALAEHIGENDFVLRHLKQYHDDLLLAHRLFIGLENNLRGIRKSNAEREYLVHSEMDADGNRSARIDRYTGRVVSVGQSDFVVDDDGERVTLKYDMLTVGSIRRVIATGDSFDEQLTLVAWLVAVGRMDDADSEYARLGRMNNVPADVTARAEAIYTSGALAPEARLRLTFLAMRAGRRPWQTIFPAEGLLGRLADAQRRLDSGARDGFAYVAAGSDADPELISLAHFAKAVQSTDVAEITLRIWVNVLEPLNANAHVALAKALLEAGQRSEARAYAGKALLLDGSNDAAWRIWLG